MATFVATSTTTTVATVDLTDRIKMVEINRTWEDLQYATFGSGGRNQHIAGLEDGEIAVTFIQDYASTEVEDTIEDLGGTVITITVKPTSGSTAAENKLYTVTALVTELTPIRSEVGQITELDYTWPLNSFSKASS